MFVFQLFLREYMEPTGKKQKISPYFVPELVHIVAATEEKLPFVFLGEEVWILTLTIETRFVCRDFFISNYFHSLN